MFFIVLIGIGLTALTVMIHGIGTVLWIQYMQRKYGSQSERAARKPDQTQSRTRMVIWILCWASVSLATLHMLEVSVWAFAYLYIADVPSLNKIEETFYFSMVTFASLGYGDLVIENSWRILSGIQAMAGMLVFGWSSALLLTVFLRMIEISDESS